MNDREILVHLKVAKTYASLSQCKIKDCALIIQREGVVLAGINSKPRGEVSPHEDGNGNVSAEVIHAELMVLLNASKNNVSTENSILLTTGNPCFECAKAIAQSGISGVYYGKGTKSPGLKYLEERGIGVEKINDK